MRFSWVVSGCRLAGRQQAGRKQLESDDGFHKSKVGANREQEKEGTFRARHDTVTLNLKKGGSCTYYYSIRVGVVDVGKSLGVRCSYFWIRQRQWTVEIRGLAVAGLVNLWGEGDDQTHHPATRSLATPIASRSLHAHSQLLCYSCSGEPCHSLYLFYKIAEPIYAAGRSRRSDPSHRQRTSTASR
jgi:hypothetical protein